MFRSNSIILAAGPNINKINLLVACIFIDSYIFFKEKNAFLDGQMILLTEFALENRLFPSPDLEYFPSIIKISLFSQTCLNFSK